jgi:hypothetical protein
MKNRFYITEEDKKNILHQHKNYVNEQGVEVPGLSSQNSVLNTISPQQQVPQQVTTQTTTPPQGKVENIQPGIFNQKVMDLQKKLNEKYKSGLIPDGKWGPKTSLAVANVLKGLPKQ